MKKIYIPKKFNIKIKLISAFLAINFITITNYLNSTFASSSVTVTQLSETEAEQQGEKNATELINKFKINKKNDKSIVILQANALYASPEKIKMPKLLKDLYYQTKSLSDSNARIQEQVIKKQLNMMVDPAAPYGIDKSIYYNCIKKNEEKKIDKIISNKINNAQEKSSIPLPIASINVDKNAQDWDAYSNMLVDNKIINTVLDDIKPVNIKKNKKFMFDYDKMIDEKAFLAAHNSFFNKLNETGHNSDNNLYCSIQICNSENNNIDILLPILLYNKNDEKARIFCEQFVKYFLLTLNDDIKEIVSKNNLIKICDETNKISTLKTTSLSHPVSVITKFSDNAQQQAFLIDDAWLDIYSTAMVMALNKVNGISPNYAEITLDIEIIDGKIIIYVNSEVTGDYLNDLEKVFLFIKNAYDDDPKHKKVDLNKNNLNNMWQGEFNLEDVENEIQIDWKNEKRNKFYVEVLGEFKTDEFLNEKEKNKTNSYKIKKFLTNISSFEVIPKKIIKNEKDIKPVKFKLLSWPPELLNLNQSPEIEINNVNLYITMNETME